MPLTFTVFGACSALVTQYVNPDYERVATIALICNLLIILVGIYLAVSGLTEPYWITITSIVVGFLSVSLYTFVKCQWIQKQIDSDTAIKPQLF